MSNIFKVFRLLIDEKFDFFKKNTNRKKALSSTIKYFVLAFAVTLICYYIFYRVKLYGINLDSSLLGLIILVTQVIALCMSLGGIISNLYNSKDSELLMCLPASHNQIFISKLIVMYVSEFISNLMYFLPIFLSYGLVAKVELSYYLLLPLYLVLLPLLPMAIAAFISIPVTKVLNFLKERLYLMVLTVLSLCSIGIYLYMTVLTKIFLEVNLVGKQIQTVIKINEWLVKVGGSNYLYTMIAKSLEGSDTFIILTVMTLSSLLLVYLATLLVKPFYFKMVMKSSETKIVEKKRKSLKEEKVLTSLIRKEFYTVFRTPGYIFQYFIYTLLMPLIVFVYDKLLISITVSSIGQIMIGGAHILVLSILALLSCTISASAISREGGTYYIMKTSPVSFKKQVLAKLMFNFSIVFIFLVLTMITSLIFIDISPFYIIVSTIIVTFLTIGQICWNFDMDLRNPTLDWYDSSEISSISKNTVNSIVASLVVSALVAYIVFLFAHHSGVWYVTILISMMFAIGRMRLLDVRVNHYFKHNEV